MAEAAPSGTVEALLAHREWVRGLARALVRDDAEAADLEQEVWLAAVRRPPRDASSPRGWLATALRHALSNLRRGQRRRGVRERASARPEAGPSAGAVVAEAEAHRRVVDAVMDLEEPYRTAVLLRFFEGLDLAGVAARTGVPAETARTRLRRARERLRGRLASGDGDRRRALGLALLPLLRDALPGAAPAAGTAAPLLPVAGGLAMTAKSKTVAVAAAAALLLLVATGFLLTRGGPGDAGAGPASIEIAEAEAPPSGPAPGGPPPAETPPPAPPPPPPAPETVHRLRVRVLDPEGRAVSRVPLLVGGAEDPIPEAPRDGLLDLGARPGAGARILARRVETGEDGAWAHRFPGPRRLTVALEPGVPGFRAEPGSGESPGARWLETPEEGIEFRVRVVPTGLLRLRAVDASTGWPARDFRVAILGGPEPRVAEAEGDLLETRVEVPGVPGAPVASLFVAHLLQPVPYEPAEAEFELGEGGEAAVELRYRSSPEVRGRVLGPDGEPVADAVVWLGTQEDARGDEPFRPFQEKRLRGAVRTDSGGQFEIRGRGRTVSAWHPDLSPASVPAVHASEVRLGARGAIEGRIVDERGDPLAGVPLSLDREPVIRTGEDGSFRFEKVEAGAHGILRGSKQWIAVRVRPGETTAVTLGPGRAGVRVRLRSGDAPWKGSLGRGAVIPLGEVGSLLEFRESKGETLSLKGILPGSYLLLDENGRAARFEVPREGDGTEADLGTATLTVLALPGTRLTLLPPGADDFVALLARRIQRLQVPKDGTLRLHPLPEGRHRVEAGDRRKDGRARGAALRGGCESTADLRPPEGR
jgi:RNA polymerase sigma-70 factor (ECF subfamily)